MYYFLIPAILLVLVLILSFGVFLITFYSPKKRLPSPYKLPELPELVDVNKKISGLVKEVEDIPFEEIWITSFDGTKLYGRYYHISDDAPLHIQFHGYRGTAFRDFCGGNKLARELGHDTLLVDQRAHGKSEGNVITFGIRERFDCKCWADYAAKRFGKDKKIILSGISMGASTVLMASDLDLPKNVKGIIADCPYSDPKDIIKKVCKENSKLPKWLTSLAWLGAFIFGKGLRLSESSALKSVVNSSVPILIFHGEADLFVPIEMSKKLRESAPEKITLHTVPKADHGYSFLIDEDRYISATIEFLDSVLK